MQAEHAPFEPLINAVEPGKLLGKHPVTLLRWAREGRLPAHRLGRNIAFRASELDAWLAGATLIVPFVPPNRKGEGA